MEFLDCYNSNSVYMGIMQEKKLGKLVSGYLFYGNDSESNWQFIHNVARFIMCNDNGCKVCPDCIKAKEGTHPDIVEFPKGKSLSVEDSKQITLEAIKKPMIANKKILIINDINNSSEEAQNKLLKTLEEPPQNVIFLVSTTNLNKVLPTVISRLVKKQVEPLKKEEIEKLFEKNRLNDHFTLAMELGGGYIGKTRNILQNDNFLKTYSLCQNIVCSLKNTANMIDYIPQKLDKDTFNIILENLSNMYRDVLMLKLGQRELVLNTNLISKFEQVKDEYSILSLQNIIYNIDDANKRQFSNVAISLILQTLLIKDLEVKFLCK